ncbi:MAG: response regulator [candidate division Zixibacteria bacterium]|jgi:CheY-like chemotaxis protein|nr:response regulator [candidate division Zixibacteria bacterium]
MQYSKKILVVDDQPEVANQIASYVRALGYMPIVVNSVEEAISNFDPNLYGLIISDVIMPGKNGFDLVRFIKNEHPQIPVALISGYFDKQMMDLQRVFNIDQIYRKPVFLKTVKKIIESALAAG